MQDIGGHRPWRRGVASAWRAGSSVGKAAFLLVAFLLAGCDTSKDDDVTRKVLVDAHVALDVVSHLTTRYEETGWDNVGTFRESPEGLATRQFLSEYSKPVSVDPGVARARELGELSLLTSKLVTLAVEPRGTVEQFFQELYDVRSRLEKALSAVEAGTKSYVRIEVRTKTEEKALDYFKAVGHGSSAAPGKADGPGKAP